MPRSTRLEDKYNNNISGLAATTYQEAIDEIFQLNSNTTPYFINNWSGSLPNIVNGTNNAIIGKGSFITSQGSPLINDSNFIIGTNSSINNTIGRQQLETINNFVLGNNASIKAGSNSIQLGSGNLEGNDRLAFQSNIIADENGLFTAFQPLNYSTTNDNSVEAHLIGIHNKFADINLVDLVVPLATEVGSVVFYDGTNLNSTTSLILDQNFCSIGTVDDRGYDWCNWQIGNNGSAFTSNKKSLGTKANPTPITDGTKIGGWGFVGDDGVTPSVGSPGYVGAEISASAIGDQTASNGGTALKVDVTAENTKSRLTILTTNNNGELVLPTVATNGDTSTSLFVDNNGVLKQGNIFSVGYEEKSINLDRVITTAELRSPGRITRYKILSNIALTPPPGFRFISWNSNSNGYVSQAVDSDFITDNLKVNIYDLFYVGNNIYISNIHPYSRTLIRAISNNGSDSAINYNTTNWQAVTLSDPSSLLRISNRYPMAFSTNTFIPGYTGYFNVSHNLSMRSTGQRCHLASRIINTTTNEVIIVSDYTYIRAANGQNLDTLQLGSLDVPCISGNSYQLQLKRQGNTTNSTTLDNASRSSITIKSTTF